MYLLHVFTDLKSNTFIKSVFTMCHLFTHALSHYCTAHAASWASLIRPLYNDVQYLHNTLNIDESEDPDTKRDNWNLKSLTRIPHVIVNSQSTLEVYTYV